MQAAEIHVGPAGVPSSIPVNAPHQVHCSHLFYPFRLLDQPGLPTRQSIIGVTNKNAPDPL